MADTEEEPQISKIRCICCLKIVNPEDEDNSLPGNVFDIITTCFLIRIPSNCQLESTSVCRTCALRLIASHQIKWNILSSLTKFKQNISRLKPNYDQPSNAVETTIDESQIEDDIEIDTVTRINDLLKDDIETIDDSSTSNSIIVNEGAMETRAYFNTTSLEIPEIFEGNDDWIFKQMKKPKIVRIDSKDGTKRVIRRAPLKIEKIRTWINVKKQAALDEIEYINAKAATESKLHVNNLKAKKAILEQLLLDNELKRKLVSDK